MPEMNLPSPFFPTASELAVASLCLAPWALGLPTTDEPTEAMLRGRDRHKVAETLLRRSEELPPDAPAWMRAIRECLRNDKLPTDRPIDVLIEQGVSLRPGFLDSEAALIDRKPGERLRGAFAGTADLAYVREDGILVVVDWKFGEMGEVFELPARENLQLKFLALALATALRISAPSASVVVARIDLRHVHDDGEIVVDGHDLTQGELDVFEGELEAMADRIRQGHNQMPVRSAACGRCKSKRHCPAWEALQTKLLEAIDTQGGAFLRAPPETEEDARLYRDAIRASEYMLEILKQRYHAWLDAHPAGLPIGLGLTEILSASERRAVVDTPEAVAKIREVVGDEAIEQRPHVTIESITRAARARAEKGAKEAAEKAVVDELMKVGAIVIQGFARAPRVVRSDKR